MQEDEFIRDQARIKEGGGAAVYILKEPPVVALPAPASLTEAADEPPNEGKEPPNVMSKEEFER